MKREEELSEQGCREVAYSFKREEGLSEQGCKATKKKREEELREQGFRAIDRVRREKKSRGNKDAEQLLGVREKKS